MMSGGRRRYGEQTGVKSALEVTGECLPGPVTPPPMVRSVMTLGKVVTPPLHPPSLFPSRPLLHTQHNTHTHRLLNLEELRRVWPGGGYRENLEWNMLSWIMLVDRPESLLIPPPTPKHLHLPLTHTYTHTNTRPPAESPPTRPPLSHCSTVIHRVPKPAALLKPRKSKAWPRFKQQCSWDLLHFRQTALSVSLAINSPGGCLP